jgi:hypothetical protein
MIKFFSSNLRFADAIKRMRIGILGAGLGGVAWILGPIAFPLHKGAAYPVTADAVTVYAQRVDTPEPLLPILKVVGTKFVATGPKVSVYLNHTYEERYIVPAARTALGVIVLTFIGFLSTFLFDWLARVRTSLPKA